MVYWVKESEHQRQGIIRPQEKQAVMDALNLIPHWLGQRGLDQSVIEYVGNHAQWLEYKVLHPRVVNKQAQQVFDNWHNNNK